MQNKQPEGSRLKSTTKSGLRLSLGVSVGDSFAEFALIQGTTVLGYKRIQHTRESLKQSLQQFLQANPEGKPTEAFIAIRLSKKVIDAQLNERMAHVITGGVEFWPRITAQTQTKLTQDDHFIGIKERVLASGEVSEELTEEELNRVATELQEQKIKKISLQLLHSARNPVHMNKAKSFLTAKGFEVFTPTLQDHPQEIPCWNRNILNANIQNIVDSKLAEVHESLQDVLEKEKIHLLNQKESGPESAEPVQSIFVSLEALTCSKKDPSVDILYLGLEKFSLLIGGAKSQVWKSPWGEVLLAHQKHHELNLQPTLSIELNTFGRFDFTRQEEGWEPGPMFLGRGQKMTVLDIFAENPKFKKIPGLEDRFQDSGIQRFKNSLLALTKMSNNPRAEQAQVVKELQSLIFNKLCLETQLLRENKNLVVLGPLASVFANAFKKSPVTQVDTEDFKESFSIIHQGQLH